MLRKNFETISNNIDLDGASDKYHWFLVFDLDQEVCKKFD